MKLISEVSRGPHKGLKLRPHRNRHGKLVASMTRFQRDYIFVDTEEQLDALRKKGYKIRMGGQDSGIRWAPSLINPERISVVF